ncbi:MAG: STAS-like domain-containing protein [Deltaproteobacteria bacterium]|nr:STAS-like domain-containing protein [Deltaproteobacteria bacterium]
MKIELKKFGTLLASRPDGREAFLAFKAYMGSLKKNEPFEIDFTDIRVLTPSWADEFFTGLKENFSDHPVQYLPSKNASVIETLKFLSEP